MKCRENKVLQKEKRKKQQFKLKFQGINGFEVSETAEKLPISKIKTKAFLLKKLNNRLSEKKHKIEKIDQK